MAISENFFMSISYKIQEISGRIDMLVRRQCGLLFLMTKTIENNFSLGIKIVVVVGEEK